MNSFTLVRYNFRVMIHHNWWLLVIPLATSQLTVFWNLITQRFYPALPAQTVELVSPLLAAYLGAHLLSAEYRSGIGGILASKPVDIGKVVLMRLIVALGLVWTLGGLSLVAYYFGLEPYPILMPALAGMVSSLFLALFALTFATLFRNALAGFAVAALYWVLDLPPGPPLHPYMSLRSLTSSFPLPGMTAQQSFTQTWWAVKLVLLIGAAALYFWHGRLLFTMGYPLTVRTRQRALALAGTILALYLVSGAALKVTYGYLHRGRLDPDDATWFRRQFASYGPIPMASLFGANFQRYVGEIPNTWRIQSEGEADRLGSTLPHIRDLRRILETAPDSLWAASAADLLARIESRRQETVEQKVSYYRAVVDKYPNSPYVSFALRQIARTYTDQIEENRSPRANRGPNAPPPDRSLSDGEMEARALAAYEDLVTKYPGGIYQQEALRFLSNAYRRRGDPSAALRWTEAWIQGAPVQEKFSALLLKAEILRDQGKTEEAKQFAAQAETAVRAFRNEIATGALPPSPARRRWEEEAKVVDGKLRAF